MLAHPEAQCDARAPVPVIVDQKFGSPPAGNRLLLELEAHGDLRVGADAYEVWIRRTQQ